MNIRDSFERLGFTPEEKTDLAARLERAAEQEENMTRETKRKIKKISGGMIFGVAAAAVMTVGALAAVLNPGLRTWFDTTTPGASSALEDGIYRLNRSETYNGWTVTLDECVGDDYSTYIWVDLTAPEGTVLAPPEGGYLQGSYLEAGRMAVEQIPDEDPTDNKMSFIIQGNWQTESLRGQTITIRLAPFKEYWWTGQGTDQAEAHEGNTVTEPIKDHEWVFEDVTLDFPDQTIRLAPNAEVTWNGGTTTVTRLEVSPLSVRVDLEGGTCADYLTFVNTDPFSYGDAEVDTQQVTEGGFVITFGTPSESWYNKTKELESSMTVETVLKDGSKVSATANVDGDDGTRQGIEGPETPFAVWCRRYSRAVNGPTSLVDPAQVDHVTVCGVDIPVDPAASVPVEQFTEAPVTQPKAPEQAEPPQEAAPTTVGTVTAGKGLNVRSGPGTQYKVVDGVKKGTQLTILGEENGFYQVDYAGGKTGYVSKRYVEVK